MKLQRPIVFFDLETTGVNITTDRIVQIAAIKIDVDGTRTEKTTLINPTISIPKEATEVHGITDDMVKDQPTFKQISKSLFSFFEGCDIGGYNSDVFDVPLLIQEFHRCEIEFPTWEVFFLDGLKIERIINSHKLEETFKRYTGKTLENAHDALADTQATFEVISEQIGVINGDGTRNEDITIEQLDKFIQGDNLRFDYAGKCYMKEDVVYWSFGKNKDNPVLDDRGYLNWVLTSDFPIQTKKKLKELLTKE